MGLDDVVSRLVEEIKLSSEFSRLKQVKLVISKKPDLYRELEEYSLSQSQLFSGKLSAKEAEPRMKQLDTKLANLSKIPEVRSYLDALSALNKMMTRINSNISERLVKSLQ